MLKLVKPDVKYKSQIAEVIEEIKNNSNEYTLPQNCFAVLTPLKVRG